MKIFLKVLGGIGVAVLTLLSAYVLDHFQFQRNNQTKYLDVQSNANGGFNVDTFKDGLKVKFIEDGDGKEIDGFRIVQAQVFNFSNSFIDEATLTLKITRSANSTSTQKDPLEPLSIKISRNGIIDDEALETVTKRHEGNALLVRMHLKNILVDESYNPRTTIDITMPGWQTLDVSPTVVGTNVAGRNFEWSHIDEANDPLGKLRFLYAKIATPLVLLASLAATIGIFLNARNRDKSAAERCPAVVRDYLLQQGVPQSTVDVVSGKVVAIIWNETLKSVPRYIRWAIFKPKA